MRGRVPDAAQAGALDLDTGPGKFIERDANGDAVRAIGNLTDITARKEAEQRLADSAAILAAEKERLRVTRRSIGDAVICTNAAGLITFMNPVAEKLTGVSGADAIGRPLDDVYRAQDEGIGKDYASCPGWRMHSAGPTRTAAPCWSGATGRGAVSARSFRPS